MPEKTNPTKNMNAPIANHPALIPVFALITFNEDILSHGPLI